MDALILRVPAAKMGKAMTAAFNVERNNPQQKSGTGNGIKVGNEFVVIRNANSYTVKEIN